MSDRQYGSYGGTPIKLRTNRQTTDDAPRPRLPELSEEDENPDAWTTKTRTSAIKRTAYLNSPKKTKRVRQRTFDRYTLIIAVSLLIIVMVGGWFVFTKIQEAWISIHDNFVYGTPFRTFQADQYMNMGDTPDHPDHFIALNLHGVIEIIQIDPVDRKRDAVYVLASVGDENTAASLSFRDTTGSGRTDVIVTIGESAPYTIVLINNGTSLTPTQPAH